MSHNHRTIVFDLDGTLVDTAPDLVHAINSVVTASGDPAVHEKYLRPIISSGGREMIRAALAHQNRQTSEFELDALNHRFLVEYSSRIAALSKPYQFVFEELWRLREDGWRTAVCTNKLVSLARALLDELTLTQFFHCIAGRDTFPTHKPDPRHLLATIAHAGGDPLSAVMIGDSETDVIAARQAGIPVIGVTFGYTTVPIENLGCDAVIRSFRELAGALKHI
ncbi:MAG: HAD-IA family hydrolase [Hyphomicrobiaceae bacterium]